MGTNTCEMTSKAGSLWTTEAAKTIEVPQGSSQGLMPLGARAALAALGCFFPEGAAALVDLSIAFLLPEPALFLKPLLKFK